MSFLRRNAPLASLIAASIGLHVGIVMALPAGSATAPRPPATVEIDVVAPPPPREVVAEPAARTYAPAPRTVKPVTPRPAPKRVTAPAPTPTPAPAAPEAPADLTGVTLTNDHGGWSSATGNGEQMTGAIGARTGEVTGRRHAGNDAAAPKAAAGEVVVAAGDLSRPPKPPGLEAQLAANYPAAARTSGLTGRAKIRLRVHANGSVGGMRVISQSSDGFGTACIATLRGSHWEPPLDADGRAVATDVAYTCEFEVVR